MTSLISRPTIDLSVSYDCDSALSLYNVWRVTSHECLQCKQTSLLRLNNRSWRLLNEKLLRCSRRKIDHSFLSLNNAPLDSADLQPSKPSQHLIDRPSLFLNHSKSTQESRLSLLRNQHSTSVGMEPFDSGDETSDISEDDEYEYSDEEDPLYDSSGESHCNHRQLKQSRFVDHASENSTSPNSVAPPPPAPPAAASTGAGPSRQNSIAKQDTKNIFYIGHSPSPPETDKAVASTTSAPANASLSSEPPVATWIKRQDSLFSANDLSSQLPPNHLSSLSSTDISEDEEYNLDEDEPLVSRPHSPERRRNVPDLLAMLNSKTTSRASKSANEDNESEWMSISSDSEQVTDSPHTQPLTFAKIKPGRTQLKPIPGSEPISEETRRPSPVLSKPRSLLSGLFLSEMAHGEASSPISSKSLFSHPAPKPVLKRSSTTGVITVDKNSSHRDQSKMLRTSIIFSKRYASLTDISKKMTQYRSPVLLVEEEDVATESGDKGLSESSSEVLLAKQTSSVELSNFMATANPSITMKPSGPIQSDSRSPRHDTFEGNLSSSLSKYSSLYPSAGSSFKNILSKSSLSISSLFGQGKMSKLRPSMLTNKSDSFKPQRNETVLPSLFAGYLSQQNSQDALEVEPEVYSRTTPSKTIKVAASSAKSFEPSVEISNSLKDSLMIDHKLGKIPLPERVISDEDLLRGIDKQAFVDDSNDYHLKGW